MKSFIRISLIVIVSFVWSSFTSVPEKPQSNKQTVIDHAIWQTSQEVTYDGSYRRIDYPNGDVPENIGVCTDVIIRAYRSINIDLQVLIHEDMVKNKSIYQKRRTTKTLDRSIDHRRCPNMRTFLERQGARVTVTRNGSDYEPGDIVFWDIAAGHVGMVVDTKVAGTDRYEVVHNIGWGPYQNDFLFEAEIVDHFRWWPSN